MPRGREVGNQQSVLDELAVVERGFHVEAVARVGEYPFEDGIGEDAVQTAQDLLAGLEERGGEPSIEGPIIVIVGEG